MESIKWLSVLTALISYLSEYLVNAIEGACVALGIPVILLPIVGNAAEHASAVMFAMKDKLEGTSNYFKGLMLHLCYLIVAASYFVHTDPESIRDDP